MSTRDRQPNQIATIARDAPSVWRRRFARACVLSVTATGGAACVLAGLVVAACDNEAETSSDTLDAAPPPPPGACAVGKTATRLCDAAAAPDSGHSDDDGGDAGGAVASDAGGQDAALVAEAPPESENLCLVTEVVTVACPSQLASLETVEGKSGSTDIVLSQVGLGRYASPTNASLVPDDQAHLQHIRVDEKGNGVVVVDPLAPFVANGNAPPHAFGLLGATATSDTQLLFFSKTNEASLSLRSGP
ncbi:MAG TPA: hypothetical protein VM580_02310, partial [Labilithrix sp.]|nr:hypothetical protein [Labilithrix sp.]